jgi:hypothetical protein
MPDRLIPVELVQHRDATATGILLDEFGGLAVLNCGVGLRLVLPPEEARELARRLDVVADRREAAEAMMAEAGVAGHA